jgi:hypothetical protein
LAVAVNAKRFGRHGTPHLMISHLLIVQYPDDARSFFGFL